MPISLAKTALERWPHIRVPHTTVILLHCKICLVGALLCNCDMLLTREPGC